MQTGLAHMWERTCHIEPLAFYCRHATPKQTVQMAPELLTTTCSFAELADSQSNVQVHRQLLYTVVSEPKAHWLAFDGHNLGQLHIQCLPAKRALLNMMVQCYCQRQY